MNSFLALGIGIGSGLAMIIATIVLFRYIQSTRPAPGKGAGHIDTAFLIQRDGAVIDSTTDALEILGSTSVNGVNWDDLHAALSPRFPDLPADLPTAPLTLMANDFSETELTITVEGHFIRLCLNGPVLGIGAQHRIQSSLKELDRISSAFDLSPIPMWETDESGRNFWQNAAYEKLCRAIEHPIDGASPFDLDLSNQTGTHNTRTRVEQRHGSARWFEITSRKTDDGWVHFASDIDTLIDAEVAQRNFVQTLTKTFAHLPIGLAVFDRDRRLVLFNPALVDLTRLPVDFLSARPNLMSFFDHMRDNRMMPEPKNYANWREQLNDVISAARDDRYSETWNLASGLTYKITGRPHPDGAVAFLLEDISAEISLTRRFRSELELTQSVIDCFSDAVAVFSRLGVLTFSNSAYRELWECDPDSSFAEISIVDATAEWTTACHPSPVWGELRDYVLTMQDRQPWDVPLTLRDGRHLQCMIEPVAAGATLVRFTNQSPAQQSVPEQTAKLALG
ncbi:MAG: PAS-domain containing protein [Pelagimonas sp.]|nr:PAS-domain containing protein [Pelagimonas sp.]